MDKQKYLQEVDKRFKELFPNSHLIIGYQMSSSKKSGTDHEWTLFITFDELADEDLKPTRIFETYKDFNELENRLNWYIYKENVTIQGIIKENEAMR